MSGWDDAELCQDYDKRLSAWFSSRLDSKWLLLRSGEMTDTLNELVDSLQAKCVALIAERDALIEELEAAKREIERVTASYDRMVEYGEALQAKLDALMLEYCPDEMTQAQKDTWASHQVAAGAAPKEQP